MSKLTSRRIWKCIIYEGYGDFCASYYPSKSAHGGKSESVTIIMRCQKKRHGHNNEFWALPLNQRGTNPIGPTLIQWRRSKLKIVAVSFFLDTAFGCKKIWKFEWTLEADNYGLKPPNLKNYNILEFSGRHLSHGTTLYRSDLFKKLSNLRFSFSSFGVFWAFSAQSSWRPIVKTPNLKVWTLPLIFLHDSTLFVIDMHQKRSISLVSTLFYHFHFHPLAGGLNCYPHLISCPKLLFRFLKTKR